MAATRGRICETCAQPLDFPTPPLMWVSLFRSMHVYLCWGWSSTLTSLASGFPIVSPLGSPLPPICSASPIAGTWGPNCSENCFQGPGSPNPAKGILGEQHPGPPLSLLWSVKSTDPGKHAHTQCPPRNQSANKTWESPRVLGHDRLGDQNQMEDLACSF